MKLVAVFLMTLFISSLSVAEEAKPKAGRLASGKAYRVDADGFQLVDELAELEVANHDLQRQLKALENELVEKNRQIEDIRKGKNIEKVSAVSESDLLKSAAPRAQAIPAAKVVSPSREIELTREIEKLQRQIKSIEVANWNIEAEKQAAQSLMEQVAKQQVEIKSKNDQIANLQSKIIDQQAAGVLKEQIAKQQVELQSKNDQLALLQSKLNDQQVQLSKSSGVAQELDQQRNVTAKVSQELDALRKQLRDYAAMEKAYKEEQAKFASLAADHQKVMEQYAGKKSASEKQLAAVKPEAAVSYQRASLAPAPTASSPIQAVDSKNISNQLAMIQNLISNRKHLLDSHKARGGGVSVTVQPLVAKNGQSLDQLRSLAARLGSQEEAIAVSKSIAEISAKLNEDIALLTRLANL